jgi:hypothetical protein
VLDSDGESPVSAEVFTSGIALSGVLDSDGESPASAVVFTSGIALSDARPPHPPIEINDARTAKLLRLRRCTRDA